MSPTVPAVPIAVPIAEVLAVTTVVVHLAYLLFVALGALLALRNVRWLAVHLPTVAWGVLGLVMTKTCPVTLLEKWLWRQAGHTPYNGTFLRHYVFGAVLPEGAQGPLYWVQGVVVLGVYAVAVRTHLAGRPARRSGRSGRHFLPQVRQDLAQQA